MCVGEGVFKVDSGTHPRPKDVVRSDEFLKYRLYPLTLKLLSARDNGSSRFQNNDILKLIP